VHLKRIRWATVAILGVFCLVERQHVAGQAPADSAVPVDIDVPFAPIAIRAQGQIHLFYEVHLTNFRRVTLELTRLEVHADDAGGQLLAGYTGQELTDRLLRPGAANDLADKRVIGDGLRAVVFVHLAVDAQSAMPTALRHNVVFRATSSASSVTESAVSGGRVNVVKTEPLALASPLRGGDWLAANGPSNGSEHRRALMAVNGKARIAQRFAIDWVKFGPDGRLAHDDVSINANWYGYGSEVLAVADGTVVAIEDGIRENVPLTNTFAVPITIETIAGNYAILDVGERRYAMFMHLQPGSLRVTAGSKVRQGQVLGLLGNSGNSDAPHLHFQITDGSSPLGSEGLPFVLKSFHLVGAVDSLEGVLRGAAWKPQSSALPIEEEIPLDNVVLRFP
jgi:murein DD-endopeptidase